MINIVADDITAKRDSHRDEQGTFRPRFQISTSELNKLHGSYSRASHPYPSKTMTKDQKLQN